MRRWSRFFWVTLLPLALAACSSAPVHKPAELKPINNPEIQVDVVWRRGLGNGTNGLITALRPLVHGQRVYAADANGNVWAFKRKNGDTIWKHGTHINLLSGPALAEGLILVGGLNGQVVALDSRTGKKRWETQLSSEVLSPPDGANGVIVVRTVDGIVYGLSATDGTRRWSFARREPRLTLRGTSAPIVVNGEVIVGLDNGKVVALSLNTGKQRWKAILAVPTGGSDLQQIVDVDGRLGHQQARIFAASYGGQLASLDTVTGQVNWRDKLTSYSGITVGRYTLFVSDSVGTLYSLDAFNGEHNWKNPALGYRGLTRPVLQGDEVVVGDREGYLHWFTRAGGQLVGRFRVEDVGLTSAPVVKGQYLYVEADNGRLTALKVRSVKATEGQSDHGGESGKQKENDHSDGQSRQNGGSLLMPGLPSSGAGSGEAP